MKGKQGKGETEVKIPFLGLLVGNEIKGILRDLASGADLPKIVYKARSGQKQRRGLKALMGAF